MKILQVGAGGTGSWFARNFIHMLLQRTEKNTADLEKSYFFDPNIVSTWTIQDPDTVELRNIIRQPFAGGRGEKKAKYLSQNVEAVVCSTGFPNLIINYSDDLLSESNPEWESSLQSLLTASESELMVIVCCVDNTYTRNLLEDWILSNRGGEPVYKRAFLINMGVSPAGDYLAERVRWDYVTPTEYPTMTLPDGDMSCAARAERGHIAQTLFSNSIAGLLSAQLLNELISAVNEKEILPIKRFMGRNGEVANIDPKTYYA